MVMTVCFKDRHTVYLCLIPAHLLIEEDAESRERDWERKAGEKGHRQLNWLVRFEGGTRESGATFNWGKTKQNKK